MTWSQPPNQYPPQQAGGWSPPPPPPSMPNLSNHVGELVHLRFHSFERDAALPWGIKDAVDIEWDVLTGPAAGEHDRMQVSNVILVRQLKDQQPGREFFGRVATQASGKGNPAVFLGDPWPGDQERYIAPFMAQRGGGAPPAQQQQQQQPAQQPAYPQQPQQEPAQPAYPQQAPQAPQQPAYQQQPPQQPYQQPTGPQQGAQPQQQAPAPNGYGPPAGMPPASPPPQQPQPAQQGSGSYDPPPF